MIGIFPIQAGTFDDFLFRQIPPLFVNPFLDYLIAGDRKTIERSAFHSWQVFPFAVYAIFFGIAENLLLKIKSERPDFKIYTGTEELLLVSLVAGADGATVVTGGIRPDDILSIVNDFKRGDIAAARSTQLALLPHIAEGFQGVFPSGFRKQVAALGFAVGPDR